MESKEFYIAKLVKIDEATRHCASVLVCLQQLLAMERSAPCPDEEEITRLIDDAANLFGGLGVYEDAIKALSK